jgi:hypothetical protein
MTARRAPRIAASLYERRNDLRPVRPWPERLLSSLGARSSFADAVLGDLAEERARREAQHGTIAARWWYAREALRSAPHMVWNALRHGGPRGYARIAGSLAVLLAVLAVPPALVAAFLLRDVPAAQLIVEGQRGSDVVNAVVLNSRHPVQLAVRALDVEGRALPHTSVRYRWASGVPVSVTPSGAVTCGDFGDAEVRASAGAVATTVLVRCRPVSTVGGDMVLSLIAGGPEEALPLTALGPDGHKVELIAFEARVQDSSIAALKGLRIRPVAPGVTSVSVKVGDGQTRIWVNVYEPVRTLAGLRPDQRLVSAPVQLAAGDTIRWPLPTGHFWLRFNPVSRSQPVPRIVVSGQMSCMPELGPTDQASCLVRAPGASIRITHPRGSRGQIAGNLALERRDP